MDRIDALLDSYLETGRIPDGASAEERGELAELIHAAAVIRSTATEAATEAAAATPTGRARFERFVAGSRVSPAPPRAEVTTEPVSRRRSLPFTIGAGLAALVLVAVVALGASTLIDNRGVHTAHALEPGDFAQIEGVVTRTEDRGSERVLRVATAIGDINVDTSDGTSVVDANDVVPLASVQKGMSVYVGGIVSKDRRIAAQTVAVSGGTARPPVRAVPRRLRSENTGLQGRVAVFSLAEDAGSARVVVAGEEGRLYVATVTGDSALALLALERPLGAVVRVLQGPAGSFEISIVEPQVPDDSTDGPDATVAPGRPDRPASDAPALVSIQGLVVSSGDGLLTVRTRRGLVTVEVGERTRVVPGASGLTREHLLAGRGDGHLISVRGGLAGQTNNVIANVVLVRKAVLVR